MTKKNFFLMGPPGSGKSTLLLKVVMKAQENGLKISGILTPDIRRGKGRIGFFIENLLTREKRVMAKVGSKGPYTVGRYTVYVDAIDAMSDQAIHKSLGKADLVCIDEIGKMELFSPIFKDAVQEALNSDLPVIGSIGKNLHDPFVQVIINRSDTQIITLDRHTHDAVYQQLLTLLGLKN